MIELVLIGNIGVEDQGGSESEARQDESGKAGCDAEQQKSPAGQLDRTGSGKPAEAI